MLNQGSTRLKKRSLGKTPPRLAKVWEGKATWTSATRSVFFFRRARFFFFLRGVGGVLELGHQPSCGGKDAHSLSLWISVALVALVALFGFETWGNFGKQQKSEACLALRK